MVVKTTSYNSGVYNAEITEGKWFDYRITARFNEPAEAVVHIRDVDGSLAQKYIDAAAKDLAGGVADDGGAETDETTETNNAAANDMTLLPAAPAVNDAYYFAFDTNEIARFTLNIGTEGLGIWNIDWEYSKGADAWAALADVVDDTLGLRSAGENNVSWTIPGDWAIDEVGSISGKYWVRARVSEFTLKVAIPIGTQAWYNKVWIGPGRLKIENPASTPIFDCRILKATHNSATNTLTLFCRDWLSQLMDDRINYDMREDIDGSGLRESVAHSDPDGAFVDVAENDGGTLYFYDDGDYNDADGWDWANDQFNGNRLVFTIGMAGKKIWRFFPYQGTATDEESYIDQPNTLWVDDVTADGGSAPNDWTLDYDFRVYLGHDDPSDFYKHNSITGARVGVVYQVGGGANNHSHLQVDDKTDGYFTFATLEEDDHFIRKVFELNADEYGKIVDSDGIATVRFDIDRAGGDATLLVRFLYLEVDVETEGYSLAVTINDTIATNKLEVATDLTAAATRIWEAIPYSIVREAYKHIDTGESGTLVSDHDPLVALTSAAGIEHTSGFSLRRYEERTPLEILQDLANIDKTAFWMAIGGVALTWKSTFNDGAPTAMTDDDVMAWTLGEYSFLPVFNEMHLYGPKIGDVQSFYDTSDGSPDPGADSKTRYGVTRADVQKRTGTTNLFDLVQLGEALVERDEDVNLFLNADIRGLTSLRLGDEVSITSTYLGLTAAKYVITFWEYSYGSNRSTIRLHPRKSTKGFVPHMMFGDTIRRLARDERGERVADTFIPVPEVST